MTRPEVAAMRVLSIGESAERSSPTCTISQLARSRQHSVSVCRPDWGIRGSIREVRAADGGPRRALIPEMSGEMSEQEVQP